MEQLNVYYRALLQYRKHTTANHKCGALRAAISGADPEQDKIVIKRAFCTIEEDWVQAIEKGLVHVEKAIKEERQFIRSNGEVIPIEKVKHVSKESVEHLARHSNLITKHVEGEELTPEKLFTVERLNDYAVYENRFLYMLLCYLRDFITLRYNNILEQTNKYDATIGFNKKVSVGGQKMTYSLSMHDVRRNDPYLKEHNAARDIIDRIDLILKAVLAYLATPLMQEVAKAPMLKPPITKTNVLKMNNNFKGALALYDYVVAYDKPGYQIRTETNTLSPFREDLADEMAEAGGLVAFLAYQYGLGLRSELREAYVKEEERAKTEEIKKQAERIAALKRKLKANGTSPEEYILLLEKQVRALEGEFNKIEGLNEQIEEGKEREKQLALQIEGLKRDLSVEQKEREAMEQRHFEAVALIRAEHEEALHAVIAKKEEEIAEVCEKYREEIAQVQTAAEEERARMTTEMAAVREAAQNQVTALAETCNQKVATAQAESLAYKTALEKQTADYRALWDRNLLAESRLKAYTGAEYDYSDRNNFNRLEEEYHAFTRVYKEQWAKAKQKIRKKHLNLKNLKGQTGENNPDEKR